MDKKYIVLLTDFGNDFYVGQMKGVMKNICKNAEIIDLTHNINPQNVLQAAIIIDVSYKYFPKKSIFVCVVDPLVGSNRKIILVKKEGYIFLAPDNGLLTKIISCDAKIYKVVNNRYFLKNQISYTFHGRDIFAPVAGFLARGIKIEKICKRIDKKEINYIYFPKVEIKRYKNKTYFFGKYLFSDNFGNIITNLKIFKGNLDKFFLYVYYRNKLYYKLKLKHFYSEVKKDELLALINSFNYIEIAKNCGDAYKEFLKKFKDFSQINFVLVKNG